MVRPHLKSVVVEGRNQELAFGRDKSVMPILYICIGMSSG